MLVITCVRLVLALVFVLFMLCEASLACTADQMEEQLTEGGWRLRLLDDSAGRCLDGSAPGYYYRDLSCFNDQSPNVKLHFMGGNWCSSDEECLARSRTLLGSSLLWPPVPPHNSTGWDFALDGIMGSGADNPTRDWNAVFIMYCDGSSFASFREEPAVVNGTKIFYHGRLILRSVLLDLESKFGLKDAANVLVTGTSTGGIATAMHVSLIRSILPDSVRVVAAPDAAFFVDAQPVVAGYEPFRQAMMNLVQFWGNFTESTQSAYPGTNRRCLEAHRNASWRCSMTQYLIKFIQVPVFLINSQYDGAGLGSVLGLWCSINIAQQCNEHERQMIENFRTKVWQPALLATMAQSAIGHRDYTRNSMHNRSFWISSCNQHECSCRRKDFSQALVNGVSLSDALGNWLSGASVRLLDRSAYPDNSSCWKPPSIYDHGTC